MGVKQAQLGQGVEQAPLGDFNFGPSQLVGRVAGVWQPFRLAAGNAELVRIRGLNRKIAQTDVVPVRTGAVACGQIAVWRIRSSVGGLKNPHPQLIGQKCLSRTAMHALQAVKVNQMAAGLAVENSHAFTLAAKCGSVV